MSKSEQIYAYTERKLEKLWNDFTEKNYGRGIMANLRHGVGKKPGELPELWGIIFSNMPPELMGKREISYEEQAIYTALTLYALHQQGKENNMHKKDISVGSATSGLVKNEEDTNRILNRLNLVVTAVSADDLAYHLRGIVQLLKSESIELDYARLAKELYLFNFPESAVNIKMSWGRDFYSKCYKSDNKEKENE